MADTAVTQRSTAPKGFRVALRLVVLILVLVAILLSFVVQFGLAWSGLGSLLPFVGRLLALLASLCLGFCPRCMTGLLAAAASAELVLLSIGLMVSTPIEISDCASVTMASVAGLSDWYWAIGIGIGGTAFLVMLAGAALARRPTGIFLLLIGGCVLTLGTYLYLADAVSRVNTRSLLHRHATCGIALAPNWQATAVGLFALATILAGYFARSRFRRGFVPTSAKQSDVAAQ